MQLCTEQSGRAAERITYVVCSIVLETDYFVYGYGMEQSRKELKWITEPIY